MGDQSDTKVGYSDELPVHSVYVSGFYMGRYEVTNEQMAAVLNWAYGQGKLVVSTSTVKNAAGNQQELLDLNDGDCWITWNSTGQRFELKAAKGGGYPCVEVSWYGTAAYCNYRSEMDWLTPCYSFADWSCNWGAGGYRLPTEAEWEKAARGGQSGKKFPWGDMINHSKANYRANGSVYSYDASPYTSYTYHPDWDEGGYPYTSPVGTFAPNGYGLYDMSGNVWEWCNDWYESYSSGFVSNPRGPESGSYRVGRGGSWGYDARGCRAALRDYGYPSSIGYNIGFRTVRSSVP